MVKKVTNSLWIDIKPLLTYNRNFIFINSMRGTGKTYTTLETLIEMSLKNEREFIYIVRTKEDKKSGALQDGLIKVCNECFADLDIKFNNNTATYDKDKVLCRCVAINEYATIKKKSFPKVDFLFFDEYQIEKDSVTTYCRNEVNAFLSIYDTVDRNRGKVKCFFLGNNISEYNLYHLHSAFLLPSIKPGSIYKGKNVIFYNYLPSEQWFEMQKKLKFTAMVKDTSYGKYAKEGKYLDDTYELVSKYKGQLLFNFALQGVVYDVGTTSDSLFVRKHKGNIIGDIKNLTGKYPIKESIVVSKTDGYVRALSEMFKANRLFFDDVSIYNVFRDNYNLFM